MSVLKASLYWCCLLQILVWSHLISCRLSLRALTNAGPSSRWPRTAQHGRLWGSLLGLLPHGSHLWSPSLGLKVFLRDGGHGIVYWSRVQLLTLSQQSGGKSHSSASAIILNGSAMTAFPYCKRILEMLSFHGTWVHPKARVCPSEGRAFSRGNSLKLISVTPRLRQPRALCWDPGLWSRGRGVVAAQSTALSSSPGLSFSQAPL